MNRRVGLFIAGLLMAHMLSAQQQSKDTPPPQYIQTSGATVSFQNAPGSGTISLEYLFTSGISAPTCTVQGVGQGGTAVTLTAVSGTNPYTTATNAIVTFAGGYFRYTASCTYTGTGTITVAFVGIQAKAGSSSGGGGGSVAANATTLVSNVKSVLTASATGVNLVAAYLHADCTQPYKDYSGNGYDGVAISGTAEPVCTAQGLNYALTNTYNAWQMNQTAYAAGLTYLSRLTSNAAISHAPTNSSWMGSTSASGLLLSWAGAGLNIGGTYTPAIGDVNLYYRAASSGAQMLGTTILESYLGTSNADKGNLWLNGVTAINDPGTGQNGFSSASAGVGNLYVGGANNAYGYYQGQENLTLVFSGALTPTARLQIDAFVENYALVSQSSPRIPTMTTSRIPVLLCTLDSLTAGFNVNYPWCDTRRLTTLGESVTLVNGAVSGQRASEYSSKVIPVATSVLAAQSPHNTVVVWGCTNDGGGAGCASTYLTSITVQLRNLSKPPRIIEVPMIDRVASVSDSAKNALNAQIRLSCSTLADACVSDTDPLLFADGAGGTSNANASIYFQTDAGSSHVWDGIHLNGAGEQAIANYIQIAYNWLYFSVTPSTAVPVTGATYTISTNDAYISGSPTVASAYTLPLCTGLPIGWKTTIANTSAVSAITVATSGSQTLVGSATVAANQTAVFNMIPGTNAAATCSWLRTQMM